MEKSRSTEKENSFSVTCSGEAGEMITAGTTKEYLRASAQSKGGDCSMSRKAEVSHNGHCEFSVEPDNPQGIVNRLSALSLASVRIDDTYPDLLPRGPHGGRATAFRQADDQGSCDSPTFQCNTTGKTVSGKRVGEAENTQSYKYRPTDEVQMDETLIKEIVNELVCKNCFPEHLLAKQPQNTECSHEQPLATDNQQMGVTAHDDLLLNNTSQETPLLFGVSSHGLSLDAIDEIFSGELDKEPLDSGSLEGYSHSALTDNSYDSKISPPGVIERNASTNSFVDSKTRSLETLPSLEDAFVEPEVRVRSKETTPVDNYLCTDGGLAPDDRHFEASCELTNRSVSLDDLAPLQPGNNCSEDPLELGLNFMKDSEKGLLVEPGSWGKVTGSSAHGSETCAQTLMTTQTVPKLAETKNLFTAHSPCSLYNKDILKHGKRNSVCDRIISDGNTSGPSSHENCLGKLSSKLKEGNFSAKINLGPNLSGDIAGNQIMVAPTSSHIRPDKLASENQIKKSSLALPGNSGQALILPRFPCHLPLIRSPVQLFIMPRKNPVQNRTQKLTKILPKPPRAPQPAVTNPSSRPINPCPMPANPCAMSTNSCTMHTNTCAMPTVSCTVPTNSCRAPTNTCAMPTNVCRMPTNFCTVPTNPCAMAMNFCVMPTNSFNTPTNPVIMPANSCSLATNIFSYMAANPYNMAANLGSTPANPSNMPPNPSSMPPNPSGMPSNPSSMPPNQQPAERTSQTPQMPWRAERGKEDIMTNPQLPRVIQDIRQGHGLFVGSNDSTGAAPMTQQQQQQPRQSQLSQGRRLSADCRIPLRPHPEPVQLRKGRRTVAELKLNDLYCQNEDGDTYLHNAVLWTDAYMVRALLERLVREGILNEMMNRCNNLRQTPLYIAVADNKPRKVRELVEFGADPNCLAQCQCNNGMRKEVRAAIHCAAEGGQAFTATLAELLKAKGINLNLVNSEGLTAVHCAIQEHGKVRFGQVINSIPTVEMLLRAGADPNVQDKKSGKTPLMYAIESKDDNLVWTMVKLIDKDKLRLMLKTQAFDGSNCGKLCSGLNMLSDLDKWRKINSLIFSSLSG